MLLQKLNKFYAVCTILFFLQFPIFIYGQQSEIPITSSSQEAMSYFMEGRYKYENIQYATAAALFDEAILNDPGFAMAYLYRARCGGGFNVTQENLKKASDLISLVTEGEKYFILFQKALDAGDHVKQKENITKLLEMYPDDKRVQFNAGLYYDFIVDPPQALMHYLRAIQIDEEYAAAYNKIGYDFIDLGFYSAAEEMFKKYIMLIPNSPNPYDSYAELLMKMGQYDQSIENYKTAYEKDRLFTQALAGVGNNYIFKGDFEKAREYYFEQHEKAVRMNEKLDALNWVAASYIYEGNINEAIETLQLKKNFAENEELVTDVIDTYNMMGFILTEVGKNDEAKKYFDLATETVTKSNLPENVKQAHHVNSHIDFCLWLVNSGKLDEADTELNKCSVVIGDRHNIVEEKKLNLVRGVYYLKRNDPQSAIDSFNLANTEDPLTWYYMSIAFEKLGYEDVANAYVDRINFWNQNSMEFALVNYQLSKEMNKKM